MNIKRLLIFFYIVIPFIFFTIPLFFIYDQGTFVVHFYSTYIAELDEVLSILIGHIILGLMILFLLKDTNYEVKIRYKYWLIDIFLIFTTFVLIFSHGIIAMLFSTLFVIIVANVKIANITFFLMLLLAFLNLLMFGERYMIVFIVMIWGVKLLSHRKIKELLLIGILGIFILIYVLQPLKYGELPFSNFSNPIEGLAYLLQHVSPIYYTAFLANTIDFSTTSLITEFIPFGKSLSGSIGVVDRLAFEGLPAEIISNGGRLGSNSSMYFSLGGSFILICIFIYFKINIIILKSQILVNSILMYFIIQGPYFIRRSFASFTIDIILIIFLVILISIFLIVIKDKRKIKV